MISNWSNLVARRDLLRELTLAELRTERQMSRFGWLWWLVDPLIMMLIYWAIVAGIFGRGARYDPYPVFILAAVLPWKHFASSVTASAGVLRTREGLIKAIPFPTMTLPLTVVLSRGWHFLFGLGVMVAAGLVAGQPIGLSLIQLPLLLVFQLAVVAGLALIVACGGALIRDLSGFLGHVLRIGFYLSPTLYGVDLVRERAAALGGLAGDWIPRLFLMNPFAVLITGYREAVFYGGFLEPELWALLALQAGGLLLLGYHVYQYFDRRVIKFL